MRTRLALIATVLVLLATTACGARTPQHTRYAYYPLPDQTSTSVDEGVAPDAAAGDAVDNPAPVDYVDAGPARVSRSAPAAPPSVANLPRGAIGKVEIPKVGLSQPMFEGIGLDVLANGPGHWPGTAMPGDNGNAVVAGHRVTHTHPFLDLDQLAPGDQIIFTTAAGRFVYAVAESFVVTPDATWIANPTPDPTITLFACHPKHQKTHRFVVVGHLVAAQRSAQRPPQPPPPRSNAPSTAPSAPHQSPPPPAPADPEPSSDTTVPGNCRSLLCRR
ncbi:MAG: peptidase family protein [Acidimicrobiales bacterium]|nr:peptidase family protein [Acidimicrobiales bacterium]